jgi:5-methyltetrahydropteroyltriglutamate--homocysteine methyltransferase
LKDKEILVGAVDVATQRVETGEEVAGTLREAVKYAAPERIHVCTHCGMAPLSREVAVGKLQALGQGVAIMHKVAGR